MEIRALTAEDTRANFRCGDPDLDRFFHKYAGTLCGHTGVTFIACAGRYILAMASIAHVQLEFPEPLPVLRIARFSVDRSARGQGVGGELLKVLLWIGFQHKSAGVVVDATHENQEFFARQGFEPIALVQGQSEARPAPTALFLPMRAVRLACGAEA